MSSPSEDFTDPPGFRTEADKYLFSQTSELKTHMDTLNNKIDQLPATLDSRVEGVVRPLEASLSSLTEGIRSLPAISANLETLNANLENIGRFRERIEGYEKSVKDRLKIIAGSSFVFIAGVFWVGWKANHLVDSVDDLTKQVESIEKTGSDLKLAVAQQTQKWIDYDSLMKQANSSAEGNSKASLRLAESVEALTKLTNENKSAITDANQSIERIAKAIDNDSPTLRDALQKNSKDLLMLGTRLQELASGLNITIETTLTASTKSANNKAPGQIVFELTIPEVQLKAVRVLSNGLVMIQDPKIRADFRPPTTTAVAFTTNTTKLNITFYFTDMDALGRFEKLLSARDIPIGVSFPVDSKASH
jgi:predicted nuclease with TOPRIM domain